MHPDFATWYRIAGIDPKTVSLDKHWDAIEKFAKKVDKQGGLELIRMAFAKPSKDTEFTKNFIGALQKSDPAFESRNNNLEMEILAASTTAHLFERDDIQLADTVALATVCADFQGLHSPIKVPELIDLAYSYLHRRSDKLRSSTAATQFQVPKPKINEAITEIKRYLPAEGEAATQVNINYIVQYIPGILNDLNSSVAKLVEALNTLSVKTTQALLLQQEETDILWWLFAEYSNDRKSRMSEVGHPAASIITGKELSDLTSTLPGPVAAEAFIDKMLQTVTKNRKHKETSVHDAIIAAPNDWRQQWTKERNIAALDDLCTLHFAVQRSLETDDPDEWVPAFERRSGVKANASLSPVKLAMQVYQESLLIKSL